MFVVDGIASASSVNFFDLSLKFLKYFTKQRRQVASRLIPKVNTTVITID
jgi:hypothetical protein